MREFVKSIITFLLPAILMFGLYVISDPFNFFFYEPTLAEQDNFGADNDFHTTNDLIAFADEQNYNGFIVGNSRATAFIPSKLEQIVPGSKFFNYGTPGECVANILAKLELAESLGLEIKNAVILIDDIILKNTDNRYYDDQGMEYVHHPLNSSQTYLSYTYTGFKSYLQNFYFVRDLDFKLTGKYKPYMEGYIRDPAAENGLPENYQFPPKPNAGKQSEIIGKYSDFRKLVELKKLFDRNSTNYEIIIPPTYLQEIVHPKNVSALNFVFGKTHVHDYSGINEYSDEISDFHDAGHFTPTIAQEIVKEVYRQ